jgi:hypothetical protein
MRLFIRPEPWRCRQCRRYLAPQGGIKKVASRGWADSLACGTSPPTNPVVSLGTCCRGGSSLHILKPRKVILSILLIYAYTLGRWAINPLFASSLPEGEAVRKEEDRHLFSWLVVITAATPDDRSTSTIGRLYFLGYRIEQSRFHSQAIRRASRDVFAGTRTRS